MRRLTGRTNWLQSLLASWVRDDRLRRPSRLPGAPRTRGRPTHARPIATPRRQTCLDRGGRASRRAPPAVDAGSVTSSPGLFATLPVASEKASHVVGRVTVERLDRPARDRADRDVPERPEI